MPVDKWVLFGLRCLTTLGSMTLAFNSEESVSLYLSAESGLEDSASIGLRQILLTLTGVVNSEFFVAD